MHSNMYLHLVVTSQYRLCRDSYNLRISNIKIITVAVAVAARGTLVAALAELGAKLAAFVADVSAALAAPT